MSHKAYVGIGTNLGKRAENFRNALVKLDELPETHITRRSSLYESEPHGKARKWFLNAVVELDTELDPKRLLKLLQKMETELGRRRDASAKTVSRKMDLDILLYDGETISSRNLKVPHPELANRRFVLLPLSELVPAYTHPVSGTSISALLAGCQDKAKVMLFKDN